MIAAFARGPKRFWMFVSAHPGCASITDTPVVSRRRPSSSAHIASSGQYPYPTTRIYRNWFVNLDEVASGTGCYIQLDATNENDTTRGANARGFWLDADPPGYGDLADLTFTTTSTLRGLTWTVTRSEGIGSWSYKGETRNPDGTSTYTFAYSGPSKMQVHVPTCLGCDYPVLRSRYTGFDAQSSYIGSCGGIRTWTNTTKSSLWGRDSCSGRQKAYL